MSAFDSEVTVFGAEVEWLAGTIGELAMNIAGRRHHAAFFEPLNKLADKADGPAPSRPGPGLREDVMHAHYAWLKQVATYAAELALLVGGIKCDEAHAPPVVLEDE